jgi:hypothetical protein
MMTYRPLVRSLVVLIGVYGLLLAPWPGWNGAYGGFFRAMGGTMLGREKGRVLVHFRAAERPPRPEVDTEIVLVEAARIDASGRATARILGLDTRAVGWTPTALLFALIIASPVSRSRRWRALGWGAILGHVYLLMVVAVFLWNQSSGAVPVSFLPFWPDLAGVLEESLVNQMGPSFAIPILIWLAVTFRADDAALLLGPSIVTRATDRHCGDGQNGAPVAGYWPRYR